MRVSYINGHFNNFNRNFIRSSWFLKLRVFIIIFDFFNRSCPNFKLFFCWESSLHSLNTRMVLLFLYYLFNDLFIFMSFMTSYFQCTFARDTLLYINVIRMQFLVNSSSSSTILLFMSVDIVSLWVRPFDIRKSLTVFQNFLFPITPFPSGFLKILFLCFLI